MVMPGRNFSSEVYRFGFNTQEKIEEISGTGNHNTALFWEYDTRLSTRWNIDPKIKPELSPYACFSLSPLFRIDPLGDDDFFNTKGKFLYSTKTESRDIYITGYNAMRGMFGPLRIDFYHFHEENASTLANIGKYYAKEANINLEHLHNKDLSIASRESTGLNLPNNKSLYNDGGTTMTDLMNASENRRIITISLNDGHLPAVLSDGNNFVSALKHEYDHIRIPNSDQWEHLQVYFNEISDPSYSKTTSRYQALAIRNIKSLLGEVTNVKASTYPNLSDSDINAINKLGAKWKTKFENKLKIKL
jgi:hypothetical protein